MAEEPDTGVGRWLLVAFLVVAICCLLAYRRNDPGVGGRFPDPEDAAAVAVPLPDTARGGRDG